MFGLDLVTTAGLMVLAGNVVQCNVPEPPQITITPKTAPIQYEYSMSGAELDLLKSNTVNPYDPDVDTSTGGLRHDRPRIGTEVMWGVRAYPDRELTCMWYKKIDVTIELSPKIYIASENNSAPRCRDAIREHELKHVAVDRQVINEFAQRIGVAVKEAVDQVGAMGPYNDHQVEDVRSKLIGHIQTAVDSQSFLLYQEMTKRQSKIDSLEEYERVNAICKEEKNDN